MLITIAIVGIISSVVVANFRRYKEKAYDLTSVTLARNLLTVSEVIRSQLEDRSAAIESTGNLGCDYQGGKNGGGSTSSALGNWEYNPYGVSDIWDLIPVSSVKQEICIKQRFKEDVVYRRRHD